MFLTFFSANLDSKDCFFYSSGRGVERDTRVTGSREGESISVWIDTLV